MNQVLENTKKCSKCGEIKGLGYFYKRKDSKIGFQSHCKVCIAKKGKTLNYIIDRGC